MFGSEILDVAIGLALVYLLLSLIASAVREGIEGVIKARAIYLERGIRELLDDKNGTTLARRLYEHPLVFALFPGPYEPQARRRIGGKMPTYIPARSFSAALLDLVLRGNDIEPYASARTTPALSVAELRSSVERLPSSRVRTALLSAMDRAQGDLAEVQANIEAWFDSAMDSVSGGYKRRTQLYLFAIGFVLTVALNANTVAIARHLWRNDAARQALAQRAEIVAQDTAYQRLLRDTTGKNADARARYADLASLDLPLGWERAPALPHDDAPANEHLGYWLAHVFGLLLTTFAIMLGGPFWFDALNKIMVIRSTVKPREKSPDEASEDRQKPKAPSSRETPPSPARRGGAPRGTASAGGVDVVSPPVVEPPHTVQQWAHGDDPDEGIL